MQKLVEKCVLCFVGISGMLGAAAAFAGVPLPLLAVILGGIR